MNKPKTLRSQLRLHILAVSVIPMTVVLGMLILFLARYVYLHSIDDQTNRVNYVESHMEMMFDEMNDTLDEANRNIQIGNIDSAHIDAYFDTVLDKHAVFDSIRRVDKNGNIINTPTKENNQKGFSLSYQEYYLNALGTNEPYWSNIFLSPDTSEVSLAISIHNKDDSMLIGYCSLIELQGLLEEMLLSGSENIGVVDQNGNFIAHNEFKRVEQREMETNFLQLRNNTTLNAKYNGDKKIVMSRQLPQQKLTIISYLDYYETYKIVLQVVFMGVICLGMIIVMSVLISRYSSSPIIEEIDEIIIKTGEMSSGSFGTSLKSSHLLEFDELSHNFNVMSQTIQESFVQLSDSKDELEVLNEELIAQNDEIKKNEQQISNILNNIYEGIMMIDLNCNVLWINDSVYEYFRIDKTEANKKRKCHQFIYNLDSKCYYCDMDVIKENREKVTRVIKVNDRQIEETYNPFYDEHNQFAGVIKTFRDITEKVSLESKLNAAIKMEAIGRLTGGIAHDFNNILQVIIGYSDLVMAQMRNAGDLNHFIPKMEIINDAATKAERLIKQLMTFSKLDQTNPVHLNLNQVVNEVGAMLTNVLGHDIVLKLDLEDDIAPIYADRVQMEQVIMNLCVNAKHAMQKGGTLTIVTKTLQKGDATYNVLEIKDTGIGIPEQIKEKIFDPFFTTRELGKGTGLGLAIVLGIIEKHKGFIHFDTRVDEGTTFTILLPITEGQSHIQLQNEDRIDYTLLGGIKVLVAEDEESIRGITVSTLEGYGVQVTQAADGREALTLYNMKKEAFDLLILDVIMPSVNGVEVYENIKRIQPNIKVIFTTGYSRDFLGEDFNLSLQGKILHKPYKIKVLMNTILEVLEL